MPAGFVTSFDSFRAGRQNVSVQFLQPVKFSHPLIERKAGETVGADRSAEPIARLTAREIEIPITFPQPALDPRFAGSSLIALLVSLTSDQLP